jgi:hypothetical protein
MILNTDAEYECPSCGHVAVRSNQKFGCSCIRCSSMAQDVEKLSRALRKV